MIREDWPWKFKYAGPITILAAFGPKANFTLGTAESIIYWTTFRIRRRAVWILICKTFLIRVCTCVWPPRKCKIPSMPNRISIDRFYIVKNESAFPSMHLHKSHTHSLTLSLWSLLLSFGFEAAACKWNKWAGNSCAHPISQRKMFPHMAEPPLEKFRRSNSQKTLNDLYLPRWWLPCVNIGFLD